MADDFSRMTIEELRECVADWDRVCGGMSGHEARASDLMHEMLARLSRSADSKTAR